MSFLDWLYAQAEERGDVEFACGMRCHRLVLEWRNLQDLESFTALNSEELRAIIHWMYLDRFDSNGDVEVLLRIAEISQSIRNDDLASSILQALKLQLINNEEEDAKSTLVRISQFAEVNDLDFLKSFCLEMESTLPIRSANEVAERLLAKCNDDALTALVKANFLLQGKINDRFVQVCLALEDMTSSNLLHEACLRCNIDIVRALLQSPIWSKQVSSALPYAVSNTDIKDEDKLICLQLLFTSSGTIPVATDTFALHEAARTNCPLCVHALITMGRFTVSAMKRGQTPLHEAASIGSTKALQCLLDFTTEQSISLPDTAIGSTALHLAAQNGQDESIKLILAKFPEAVNVLDFSGRSALHRACGFIVDSLFFEMVHMQRRNNQLQLLDLLLQHGANAHQVTRGDETTPLMWLVGGGGSVTKTPDKILVDFIPKHVEEEDVLTQCAQMLIARSQVNHIATNGSTALHVAVRFGFPLICRELVYAGANITVMDVLGCSPASLAKQYWPKKLVARMLLLPLPCAPVPAHRDMDKCEHCSRPFSTFFRRHHCRHCSACVCGECSSHSIRITKYRDEGKQDNLRRVCDYCYEALQPSLLVLDSGDEV